MYSLNIFKNIIKIWPDLSLYMSRFNLGFYSWINFDQPTCNSNMLVRGMRTSDKYAYVHLSAFHLLIGDCYQKHLLLLLLLMVAKSVAAFSNFNNFSPLQWWGRVKVGWLYSDCWQNRTSGFGYSQMPDLSTKMGNQIASSPRRESSRMPLFVSFFCLSYWTTCKCFLWCLIIRHYS